MLTNFKTLAVTGGLVVLGVFVAGCGQSSVVTVTRSGGIALDSSMVLALGNISGDQVKEFRSELTKALKANVDFKMLREQQGEEPLTDSLYGTIARSLAGTKQSLVLITGRYTVDLNTEHLERYGADNAKKEYIKRTFTGRLSFRLSDLTNNSLSFSRDLLASSYEEKEPNWLLYLIVDALRPDPLYQNVRSKVIDEFIDELHPHQEFYDATFFYDSKIPELQTGISYAKLGQWDKAIDLFKTVTAKYQKDENVHKAYFDLGIAYKWNYMFVDARENLEKAYLLKNESDYYDEIQGLAQFEQEYIIRQTEKSRPVK